MNQTGSPGRLHEVADLIPLLWPLLGPPTAHGTGERGRPWITGTYAGRPTKIWLEVWANDYVDDGTSGLEMELSGRTFDLECMVNPMRATVPLGDAEFDARFDVHGVPRAVLAQLFGPEQRAHLRHQPCTVHIRSDRLRLNLGSKARTLESAAAQLAFGASLLARLPEAIRDAGAGGYLEQGSLRSHPEVVARDTRARERRRLLLIGCMAALGVAVVLLIGLALSTWLFVSR